MDLAIKDLKSIYEQANALNIKDAQLATKYENDTKFARIHKRIRDNNLNLLQSEFALQAVLLNIKHRTDKTVLNNQALLNKEDYFSETTKRTIIETLEESGIQDLNVVRFINTTLVNEYFYQRAV